VTSNLLVFIIQLIVAFFVAVFAPNLGYAGGYMLLCAVYWGGYISGVRDVEREIARMTDSILKLARKWEDEAKRIETEKNKNV
jgi:hypothetical protein